MHTSLPPCSVVAFLWADRQLRLENDALRRRLTETLTSSSGADIGFSAAAFDGPPPPRLPPVPHARHRLLLSLRACRAGRGRQGAAARR